VDLKRRGLLHEPPRGLVKYKKRRPSWKYAIRKSKDYPVEQPGDLVQMDILDVHLLDAAAVKHFTARDVISRNSMAGSKELIVPTWKNFMPSSPTALNWINSILPFIVGESL
jgi:hypothetical protein